MRKIQRNKKTAYPKFAVYLSGAPVDQDDLFLDYWNKSPETKFFNSVSAIKRYISKTFDRDYMAESWYSKLTLSDLSDGIACDVVRFKDSAGSVFVTITDW